MQLEKVGWSDGKLCAGTISCPRFVRWRYQRNITPLAAERKRNMKRVQHGNGSRQTKEVRPSKEAKWNDGGSSLVLLLSKLFFIIITIFVIFYYICTFPLPKMFTDTRTYFYNKNKKQDTQCRTKREMLNIDRFNTVHDIEISESTLYEIRPPRFFMA